jgi:hypothetical protein
MALIYGEIDVEVPNIPFEELKKFIDDTCLEHIKLGHAKEEETYFQRNNRKYPWERRILEYAGTVFYNYKNTKPFDQIYKIIESLPINGNDRVILMLYQEHQPEYDFNFHFDNDNPMGFRICLGLNTDKPFLEQAKIKPEFHQHALQLKKIEDHMVEEHRYTIKPIRSNTAFCLNANSYPHRVPIGSNTCRVAIVVRGTVGSIDHLNFLQREDE